MKPPKRPRYGVGMFAKQHNKLRRISRAQKLQRIRLNDLWADAPREAR